MVNVLIVEDQRMARERLESYIASDGRYRLVKSISNAALAEMSCMQNQVDLILMDVCTEYDESGLEAAARIKKHFPHIKIIIITSMAECSFIDRARAAGAESFWYKDVSQEELLEASGIRDGENLITIPRREIEKRMEAELPYLKKVTIHLWPPERVIITVEETTPAAALESEGTVWYLDSSGKLLERVEQNEGYPAVTGLTLLAPSEGTRLAVSEEEELKAKGLRGLLAALEERELLDQVQFIDLTSGSSVSMGYENRLTVKMGLNDDFGYDLKMLQAAEEQYIRDNWSDSDTGTLDMTKRDGEAVLSRD